jgi:hypothetical protein
VPAKVFAVVTVSEAVKEALDSFAVIFATVWAVTAFVETVNVAESAPSETVTLEGTVTELTLLLNATLTPPVPAGPLSVTVPVDDPPPGTEVGFRVTPVKARGSMVNEAPIDVVDRLAVIFAVVFVVTDLVAMLKVAEVSPAGTTTLPDTIAALALLASLILSPPVGAAEAIFTVPIEVPPPLTVVGLIEKAVKTGASTVSVVEAELAPTEALTVALVVDATGTVDTGNVAEVSPLATLTDSLTIADLLDDASNTTTPPDPAFLERVTVPVELAPPSTDVGERATLLTVCALESE